MANTWRKSTSHKWPYLAMLTVVQSPFNYGWLEVSPSGKGLRSLSAIDKGYEWTRREAGRSRDPTVQGGSSEGSSKGSKESKHQ